MKIIQSVLHNGTDILLVHDEIPAINQPEQPTMTLT